MRWSPCCHPRRQGPYTHNTLLKPQVPWVLQPLARHSEVPVALQMACNLAWEKTQSHQGSGHENITVTVPLSDPSSGSESQSQASSLRLCHWQWSALPVQQHLATLAILLWLHPSSACLAPLPISSRRRAESVKLAVACQWITNLGQQEYDVTGGIEPPAPLIMGRCSTNNLKSNSSSVQMDIILPSGDDIFYIWLAYFAYFACDSSDCIIISKWGNPWFSWFFFQCQLISLFFFFNINFQFGIIFCIFHYLSLSLYHFYFYVYRR